MECKRPVLSLFSGAGGLDLGFSNAGFDPLLALDADAAAVESYRFNHPHTRAEQKDLASLSVEQLREMWDATTSIAPIGVIGGPPCQSFSMGNRSNQPDDPRRQMPEHYARLLDGLNHLYGLHFFVFENVASLGAAPHRRHYDAFCKQCNDAGFWLFEAVLDAQDYGVAQRRPRLLVVGLSRERYSKDDFRFPEPCSSAEHRTVKMVLKGLPEPVYFRRGLTPADIPHHPNHWTMVPRSPKFHDPNQRKNWSRGRSFRVLPWDKPSWTVAYGHREVHVHPEGHRRLSVLEALLLQGFPTTYILHGTLSDQYRLVGDAVPPPLARAVAEQLRLSLGASSRTPENSC